MTIGVLTRGFLVGVTFLIMSLARSASADPIVIQVANAAFAGAFIGDVDGVVMQTENDPDVSYLVTLSLYGASAMSRVNLVSEITGMHRTSSLRPMGTSGD